MFLCYEPETELQQNEKLVSNSTEVLVSWMYHEVTLGHTGVW